MEQLADGRYSNWQFIDKAVPTRIDGGDPNSNTNVLLTHPRLGTAGMRLQLAWAKVFNRTSAAHFGIGVRFPMASWRAGLWTHGTTTYTDDTTDFQSAATNDAALETTTNNDGFLVACDFQFNAIAMMIQTASTGSPARTIEYSIAGGSWKAAPGAVSFLAQTANYVGGAVENSIWINTPTDWAVLEAGHGTNVPVGKYGLRIRATTAPTVAAIASSISVHSITVIEYSIATLGSGTSNFGGIYAPLDPNGEALVMCTSNGNTANHCQALVRIVG